MLVARWVSQTTKNKRINTKNSLIQNCATKQDKLGLAKYIDGAV